MSDYLIIPLPRLSLIKTPTTCEVCDESVGCALVVPVLGGQRTCFPCFDDQMVDEPCQELLDASCPMWESPEAAAVLLDALECELKAFWVL